MDSKRQPSYAEGQKPLEQSWPWGMQPRLRYPDVGLEREASGRQWQALPCLEDRCDKGSAGHNLFERRPRSGA